MNRDEVLKLMNDSVESALQKVEFFVEATDFEVQTFWEQNDRHRQLERRSVEWVQVGLIWSLQVGTFHGFPVVVHLTFALLNSHLVCFYEPASRVVDRDMVKSYFEDGYDPKWDDGKRRAFTNAWNFHHCFYHCWEE